MADTQTRILFRDYGDNNGDLVLMCGFKVSINGVDVSDHVMGSLAWSFGSDNTCSFTLDNNNDKFVLRPSNLGLHDTVAGDTRSFADTESFATREPWKFTSMKPGADPVFVSSQMAEYRGISTYSETAKKKLYLDKLKQRISFDLTTGSEYHLSSFTDQKTGAVSATKQGTDISLYEGLFVTKSPVINIMDQVRVFVVDPNRDPVDEISSLWINVFTGFVMSAPPEHDFSTGQSSISVSCSDIRTLLKRKRVLVNSASADQLTPTIGLTTGLFADLYVANSNTTNAFADASLTFEGLVSLALMGIRLNDQADDSKNLSDWCLKYDKSTPTVDAWSDRRSHTQLQGRNKNGFGGLWFGYYYEYDTKYTHPASGKSGSMLDSNADREKFMNAWNRLTVFGINQDYCDWATMLTICAGTKAGGYYSALNALVHFLVPTGGNQVTSLLDRTFIDQMGVQREYMSIGEIIEQACERINYHYGVTGSGDIVFEFPMYDFRPQDMGHEFRDVYAVSDSVKNHSINDEANSNPCTGLKVTGGYVDQQNAKDMPDAVKNQLYTVYLIHDLLSSRYGLNQEEYSIPFLVSGASAAFNDEQYRRRLVMFGCMEFMKRLTEMSSMSVSACYNPFIRPNRPYYYNYGRRLALIESVQNTMSLFQNADTSVDSKYVRRVHDITGDIIAFSGSVDIPLKYSDKLSLDMYLSENEFKDFKQKMFYAGINIMIPTGQAGTNADGNAGPSQFESINKPQPPHKVLSCWTAEDVAAFNKVARDQGASPKDLMMIMANESGYQTWAVNDTPAPSGKRTYAMGLNQMIPISVIGTLENTPELLAKYQGASALLAFKKTYKKKGKTASYVADSDKPEFKHIYMTVFDTPAAQLEMFNAFLNYAKKISGLPQDFQYKSLDTLAAAQVASGSVKQVAKGEDPQLSNEAKAANPGLTSAKQYASMIRNKFGTKVQSWIDTMGNNTTCGTSTGSAPTQQAQPQAQAQPMFPNSLGGLPVPKKFIDTAADATSNLPRH